MLPRAWTLQQVAQLVDGVLQGDPELPITGLGGVDTAEEGDLVFAESPKYVEAAAKSRAAAMLTRPELAGEIARPCILVAEPRLAFLKALEAFAPNPIYSEGIHPTAVLGEPVFLGQGVHIGAQVTVGDSVTLEAGVVLLPGVRVGDGCHIGPGTILHPNVVLYPGVRIGARCTLHSGCVVGADGFGYAPVGGSIKKVPHIGTVRIEDEVEIGANTCIDRAKTAETVIGFGTKIDNLVHIAHNVRIGPCCLLVSQVGIAGSTTLGAGVVLAGQVGVVDHLHIGDGAQVGAQSGVRYDIEAGGRYFGSPAIPMAQRLREINISRTGKLPEALRQIRTLEKQLAEVNARLDAFTAAMRSPTGVEGADSSDSNHPSGADGEPTT